MSALSAVFNRTNVIAGGIAAILTVAGSLFTFNEARIESAVAENHAFTVLGEKLEAQQRQLDNFERRQAAVLAEIRKEQLDLRVEALVDGSARNKMAMEELQKRFDALLQKIETLPTSSGGGIDTAALNKAVAQAKRDLSAEFEGRLAERSTGNSDAVSTGEVQQMLAAAEVRAMEKAAKIMDERLASSTAAVGDGIPIATKRRIHFVEKDCVYLQSLPKQFTLKFKNGQEFCWKPSVLWFDIKKVESTSFEYLYVGGGRYACGMGRDCYLGSEEDGTRYRCRIENIYERDGASYAEVNFLKVE